MVSSCKKEGCTDPDAENYDANAKKNDGSCIFSAPPSSAGTVTDQDGNEYATIQIGTQVWIAENLRTTKYCNGDLIPNVTDYTEWQNLTTGAWSHYNNDSQYDTLYGKLYNWYAVNDTRNICPCEYHVPTDAEWTILTDYLGGETVAGGKMKSTGTQYWLSPNTDATNESGFSGLPGGFRNFDGAFSNVGNYGYWWSSTGNGTDGAWFRYLTDDFGSFSGSKGLGLSVRCLRD